MSEFEKTMNKEQDPARKLTFKERDELRIKATDEATVAAVADTGSLHAYLETLSRFERYSTGNTLLIHAQRPTATRIMDMSGWNKTGKQIKKGAKSIAIYEPQKVEKNGKTYTNFVRKNMFDVADVKDAAPYMPERCSVDQLLKALFEGKTVDVEVLQTNYPPSEPHGAFYDALDNVIYCRPGMNNADVFMSVAYALAHADMAADVDDYVPGEHEFEAECAAYTLCRKHGLPADPMLPKSIPAGFRTMKPAEIRKCLDEGHAAMKHLCSTMYKSLGKSKENAQGAKDERKSTEPGQRDTSRPRGQKRGGDAR